jgi:hypothetical protein
MEEESITFKRFEMIQSCVLESSKNPLSGVRLAGTNDFKFGAKGGKFGAKKV